MAAPVVNIQNNLRDNILYVMVCGIWGDFAGFSTLRLHIPLNRLIDLVKIALHELVLVPLTYLDIYINISS